MEAKNAPVRRARAETHTVDLPINQRDTLDITDSIDHENIVLSEGSLESDYTKMLAFMEEPIEIRIEKNSEKNAPKVIDCWVNGRGAEVLMQGKWMSLGYLPVGIPITTKRKYVEVLARSKIDNVSTDHGDQTEAQPRNLVDISTSSKSPFSVISDPSHYGREWLTRLLREQG